MRRVLLLAALCMALALVFAPAAMAQEDVDCSDFASQFGAQQFYDFNSPPGDPYNLDADDDGIACEDSEGGGSSASPTASPSASPTAEETMMESASPTATATASASASALPETGGAVSPAALSVVAALLLVGGGVASASIVRRR